MNQCRKAIIKIPQIFKFIPCQEILQSDEWH